jgi:hypothetical protein
MDMLDATGTFPPAKAEKPARKNIITTIRLAGTFPRVGRVRCQIPGMEAVDAFLEVIRFFDGMILG